MSEHATLCGYSGITGMKMAFGKVRLITYPGRHSINIVLAFSVRSTNVWMVVVPRIISDTKVCSERTMITAGDTATLRFINVSIAFRWWDNPIHTIDTPTNTREGFGAKREKKKRVYR